MEGLSIDEREILQAIKEKNIQTINAINSRYGDSFWYFWVELFPYITVEDFKFLKSNSHEKDLRCFYYNITFYASACEENKDLFEFLIKNNCFGYAFGNDEVPMIMFILERTRSLKTVINLVDIGIDLTMVDGKGRNLLFYAKNEKIFNYLLSKGVELNHVDNEGNTLLHYFIEMNRRLNYSLISFVNVKNKEEKVPLMLGKMPSQIEFLLKKGADVNAVDKMERTALFYQDDPRIIRLLADYGADLNHQDKKGNTFLMRRLTRPWANLDVVETVSFCDIDINIQNKKGETLLMLILKMDKRYSLNYTSRIEMLLEKIINHEDIDLGLKDKDGKTAADYAIENGLSNFYTKAILAKKGKECRLAI